MNLFRHILVVAALLVMAVPCVHAHESARHQHDDASSLCAAQHCSCHACDEPAGSNLNNVPQHRPAPVLAVRCSEPVLLGVLHETKVPVRRPPLLSCGALDRLRCVRLLI